MENLQFMDIKSTNMLIYLTINLLRSSDAYMRR